MTALPDIHGHYAIHENGIHEFILQDFTRAGVNIFVQSIEMMYHRLPDDRSSAVLIDSSAGVLPLNYLFSQLPSAVKTDWITRTARIAVISPGGAVANIIGEMSKHFLQLNLKMFTPQQRRQAIDWLLLKEHI